MSHPPPKDLPTVGQVFPHKKSHRLADAAVAFLLKQFLIIEEMLKMAIVVCFDFRK